MKVKLRKRKHCSYIEGGLWQKNPHYIANRPQKQRRQQMITDGLPV